MGHPDRLPNGETQPEERFSRKTNLLAFAGELSIWTQSIEDGDSLGAMNRLKWIEWEADWLCSDERFLADNCEARENASALIKILKAITSQLSSIEP